MVPWYMRMLWRLLISRPLAVYLLVILLGSLIFSTLVPNLAFMEPGAVEALKEKAPWLYKLGQWVNTQELVVSPPFWGISLLLLLSSLGCSFQRIWHWWGDQRGERWADKGFWGSIAFHLSLSAFFFGILHHVGFDFKGTLLLAEGQEIALKESGFVRIAKRPLWGPHFPEIDLKLKDFSSYYQGDQYPVDHTAYLLITDKKGATIQKEIRINEPLQLKGYQFLLTLYGFSPLVVVRDARGNIFFDSYVNLDVVGEGKSDSLRIPGPNLLLTTWFFPDFALHKGKPLSASPLPKNPVFFIQASQDGTILQKDFVRLGEEIKLGGYWIGFRDLRYWVTFTVVKEKGIGLIFGALFVGTAGLLARFFWYKTE